MVVHVCDSADQLFIMAFKILLVVALAATALAQTAPPSKCLGTPASDPRVCLGHTLDRTYQPRHVCLAAIRMIARTTQPRYVLLAVMRA